MGQFKKLMLWSKQIYTHKHKCLLVCFPRRRLLVLIMGFFSYVCGCFIYMYVCILFECRTTKRPDIECLRIRVPDFLGSVMFVLEIECRSSGRVDRSLNCWATSQTLECISHMIIILYSWISPKLWSYWSYWAPRIPLNA